MNLALLILVALVYLAEATHYVNPAALRQDERSTFPAVAVGYLTTHRLPGRVFNSYAWGGYLLWRSYPRYRAFIDGRANTLFDARILNDYIIVTSAGPGWQQVLDHYQVQTILIETTSPLVQVLSGDPTWRLRHRDNLATVFVRS